MVEGSELWVQLRCLIRNEMREFLRKGKGHENHQESETSRDETRDSGKGKGGCAFEKGMEVLRSKKQQG